MYEHIEMIADKIALPENSLPDFIYNRFDQQGKSNYGTVLCSYEQQYYIPFYLDKNAIHLGLWLNCVPKEALEETTAFLFHRFPQVRYIHFQNHLVAFKKLCDFTISNHWRVPLPDNAETLRLKLTSKARYNLKREKRIAQEALGKYCIIEYSSENVPDDVIEHYFDFKAASYKTHYGLSPKEYLKKYFVSNIYVLQFENEIGAIILSCEQEKNIYLENLTFNPVYRKYSLGKALYDEFLEILIAKEEKNIYLGGGNQEYKSHYGSIEETVYSGTIYRSFAEYLWKVRLPKEYALAKRKVFLFAHKCKKKLNLRARMNRGFIRIKKSLDLLAYRLKHKSWRSELKSYKNRETVLICAHPDDESLLFYETLARNHNILVICLSNASDSTRSEEFKNAMHFYKTNGIMLDMPDGEKISYSWRKKKLDRVMRKIKKEINPDAIYTHNSSGEYGHRHHIAVNRAVIRNFDCKIFVPQDKFTKKCDVFEAKKQFLATYYPSQNLSAWFPQYIEYEGLEELR